MPIARTHKVYARKKIEVCMSIFVACFLENTPPSSIVSLSLVLCVCVCVCVWVHSCCPCSMPPLLPLFGELCIEVEKTIAKERRVMECGNIFF